MEAWVTLATNDSYSAGALALASSLRRVGTTRYIDSSVRNCWNHKGDRSFCKELLEPQGT